MNSIRISGISFMLILSAFLPAKTDQGVDFLFPHLIRDTEAVFVTNYKGLVPIWVGQLFLITSFFLHRNLFIKSGLVAMALGSFFFLSNAYKDITTLHIILYIVFALAGGAFYWWLWKQDND